MAFVNKLLTAERAEAFTREWFTDGIISPLYRCITPVKFDNVDLPNNQHLVLLRVRRQDCLSSCIANRGYILDTPPLGSGLLIRAHPQLPSREVRFLPVGGPHDETQYFCLHPCFLCHSFPPTDDVSLTLAVCFPVFVPDLLGHWGKIASPVVSLSTTAYSSIPKVWLISRLPCIPIGRSPIRNLGTRPMACLCALEL